jgi:hypothetical protein
LRWLPSGSAGLADIDFDALIERADGQRRLLEPFRKDAGREVLAV